MDFLVQACKASCRPTYKLPSANVELLLLAGLTRTHARTCGRKARERREEVSKRFVKRKRYVERTYCTMYVYIRTYCMRSESISLVA